MSIHRDSNHINMHYPTLTDFPLDILSQKSRINRLYTQLTFCYLLDGGNSYLQPEIINTLENGLRRLSEGFPWLAGRITEENGTFRIKPGDGCPHMTVKDYSKDPSVPDWDTLQQAKFPFSMLDESNLAPCKTLESSSKALFVFLVQANFVRGGGLLLTLNGQHGAMDMAGLAQVMFLFSKACQNVAFTENELSVGNMDRRNVIPLLDEDAHDSTDIADSSPAGNGKSQQVQLNDTNISCTWAYFSFTREKLANVKSQATATLPVGTSDFISTDDALSAFVWQSISRIRLRRYLGLNRNISNLETTLSRNVDVRRHLGIPSTYPGLVTDQTVHTFPLEQVTNESLGSISSYLRSALVPESLSWHIRAVATRISHEIKTKNARSVPNSRPEFEVRLSSWAKEKCCHLDFGFGLPVAVRRPRFNDGSRDGLVYFLPKSLDGEIVVGVCLRCDDMDLLRKDKQFTTVGVFIG